MTEYAALLSSFSEAAGGILGPHPTIGEAAAEGDAVTAAQPGIRYTLLQRHPNGDWHGLYTGHTITQEIERMTTT